MKQGFKFRGLVGGVLLLCLGFMTACNDDDDGDVTPDDTIIEEVFAEEYIADLEPLNNSGVTGTALFQYINEGDGDFDVSVEAVGLAPDQVHPQHVHAGSECPPESAAGEDGLLTIEDGLPFYADVFIPLDDMLVPLDENNFPIADAGGSIDYTSSTEFDDLIDALTSVDDEDDFDLQDRTIVIHGAYILDNRIVDPGTPGATYDPTIPVACGEIRAR